MSRKRRQSRKSGKGETAISPTSRGQQAFHRGDYDQAIAVWEQVHQKAPSPELAAALAEVHFRRGLVRFYQRQQPDTGLRDLDRAAQLVPNDPRYAYHLGLAHHHLGDLDTARTAYRLALEADPSFHRAAELYVLLLLEQSRDPTKTAAWRALPLKQQRALRPLVGLVCVDAALPPQPQPVDGHGSARLWHGLAALQTGDEQARDLLWTVVQAEDQPRLVRAVAAYALGLDAMRREQAEEALAHWQAARQLGLDSPAFRHNLGLLYRHLAEQAAGEERWHEAASLAEAAVALAPDDLSLKGLLSTACQHLGYAEAQVGRWAQALTHWQKAREMGENSRALLQNLALAYEKTEQYLEAAELWRQVVRRRPRRTDAPDALTPQQVAQLWRHVSECYRRAGQVEEAITTLHNAVKNDPGNTDLHLELVDAMIAQGRLEAARNEVGRILKREPNHIEALVRAARLDEEISPWWFISSLSTAQRTWKRILQLDPNHLEARERLSELMYQEGEQARLAGKFNQALKLYRQALEYTPDQAILHLSVADCLFHMKKPEEARRAMEQAFALDPTDLGVYHSAVDLCHIAQRPDDAKWVIAQAEAQAGPLPVSFYLDLAHCCLRRREQEQGAKYLQHAEEQARDDADALVDVGAFYLDHDNVGKAISFFERALRLDPDNGWANYHVGASYALAGEMKEANRYWRQARRIARRTGDQELLKTIEHTRRRLESPFDPSGPGWSLDLPSPEDMSPEEIIGLILGAMDDDELW